MVDQMRDIFWIAERDMSKFHYISPAFERLFGYPAQMIYDHPEQLENIYHPDDRHHLAAKNIWDKAYLMRAYFGWSAKTDRRCMSAHEFFPATTNMGTLSSTASARMTPSDASLNWL